MYKSLIPFLYLSVHTTRSQRDRCFKPDADYGYCAGKDLHYYGFKLGLRISRAGMMGSVSYASESSRPHRHNALEVEMSFIKKTTPAGKKKLQHRRLRMIDLSRI